MTGAWTRHDSKIDGSVNFVAKTNDGGAFEARFVQRDPSYFIVYLSSQSGCDLACRFCHLTQLRQTMTRQATIQDYLAQARQVIAHYDALGAPAQRMNVNFMARGEPLVNPNLAADFAALADPLMDMAADRGLEIRFNISSIFPRDAEIDLAEAFAGYPVTIYWSLYSLDPAFRRRWLPKAEDPAATRARLARWQLATGRDVVIHHALIRGQNDRLCDHVAIRDFLAGSGLETRLNLVRYNSFGPRTGEEAPEGAYADALRILGGAMPLPRSKVVPRVGRDVAASCGMFLV